VGEVEDIGKDFQRFYVDHLNRLEKIIMEVDPDVPANSADSVDGSYAS